MKTSPNGLLTFGCVIVIAVCVADIGFRHPTQEEALLLSVLLTVASMLGTWVASRFYAEQSFNENLRTFALKAAEKVDNLSNEFDRLSTYLQEELDETHYNSSADELLAKEIRMEGAIHIITTLKSVNDGSLSDWQGIIGKELDERREEQVEREIELKELVERVEALYRSRAADVSGRQAQAAINAEMDTIRSEIRRLASQVGGVSVRAPKV
jgi:sensor c-di-GMP phosphodiesterase-like protein